MEDEEGLGTYGYDEEDCYSQENGQDPTQYDVYESEDDGDLIQQDSDRKTKVKPRSPLGPSLSGRQRQLHARGVEHVRAMVGGRGARTIASQRLSNGQSSIRRGKTPARGQGMRPLPQ